MKLLGFQIKNFRNLKYVECSDVPSFMVICGPNGCGKSALLEAIVTAKEAAGSYGGFNIEPSIISADEDNAEISLKLKFSDEERNYIQEIYNKECPDEQNITALFDKTGKPINIAYDPPTGITKHLLRYYSKSNENIGFFDYINANRQYKKIKLKQWDSSFLSDDLIKLTLVQKKQKFEHTKKYLASLKMQDIREFQKLFKNSQSTNIEKSQFKDSLKDIKEIFNNFFFPMEFEDVYLDEAPFKFVIKTPYGDIDIDDLSSGEKEIFNIFTRFHQLNPKESIILFDEADAHLHPDLEIKYLKELQKLSRDNQLILTTHSPQMMLATPRESLFTIHKYMQNDSANQLCKIIEEEEIHEILTELMGSKGIISFNDKIVFIEGEESSADIMIYQHFYPPEKYKISFIPVGSSSFVRNIAEKINHILSSSTSHFNFFSIVDGDIKRMADYTGERLFQLPVYHIENFLLKEDVILELTNEFLGEQCPIKTESEVKDKLTRLLLKDTHLNPFTKTILDADLANIAKKAYDEVLHDKKFINDTEIPKYSEIKEKAKESLKESIREESWKNICKGRDLIKTYCAEFHFPYKIFRNALISKIKDPPEQLKEIMDKIISI